MGFKYIGIKCFLYVICFECLEVYSHNPQSLDSNTNLQLQTITIEGYPEESKLRVIEYPNVADTPYEPSDNVDYDQSSLDTWSVVWYIVSFGGLILFFLIVSCSEWCCRRNARRICQRTNVQAPSPTMPETPPPSYDQFAPPAYEDLWVGNSRGLRGEKSEYDIYVVPVHALGTIMDEARREEAPPSYQTASSGLVVPIEIPRVHSSNASSTIT